MKRKEYWKKELDVIEDEFSDYLYEVLNLKDYGFVPGRWIPHTKIDVNAEQLLKVYKAVDEYQEKINCSAKENYYEPNRFWCKYVIDLFFDFVPKS